MTAPAPGVGSGEDKARWPDRVYEDVPARVDWWWTPEGRAEHDAALIAAAEKRGAEAVVAAVEATGSCGGLTADATGCYVADALAAARAASAAVGDDQ